MNLSQWEPTILQIAQESADGLKRGKGDRVLFAWRAKLAKEPVSLTSYQIDRIMREVRKKSLSLLHGIGG